MWYPVNGVPVSDFYTPRYFDPVWVGSGRYSFTGAIEHPVQILEGVYFSWIDPADSALYQLAAGDPAPSRLADLQQLARSSAPLRTVFDMNRATPQLTGALLRAASSAASAPGASRRRKAPRCARGRRSSRSRRKQGDAAARQVRALADSGLKAG